jgi:hypothetical protein
MKQRIDNLPGNSVGTYLDKLEADAGNLKSALQLTGGESLVYKQTDSGNTYDWSGVFTHGGGQQSYYQHFLVTATAQTQAVLLADIVWYVWANGVRKTLSNSSSLYTISPLPKASNATNVQQWFITVDWNNTDTVSVKAYILGTDVVTLTVAAVA